MRIKAQMCAGARLRTAVRHIVAFTAFSLARAWVCCDFTDLELWSVPGRQLTFHLKPEIGRRRRRREGGGGVVRLGETERLRDRAKQREAERERERERESD